jgi:hypothetical protein
MAALRACSEAELRDKVKRVEYLVERLRGNRSSSPRAPSYPSGSASNIDPSLSLVDKARMLKYRATALRLRRVHSDKSDETIIESGTYSTMDTTTTTTGTTTITRSGFPYVDDSSVTWCSDHWAYEGFVEI